MRNNGKFDDISFYLEEYLIEREERRAMMQLYGMISGILISAGFYACYFFR